MAVSAVSGLDIEKAAIAKVSGLLGRVPSLYFTNSGGLGPNSDSIYLVVRGVGFNGGQEPATGVFVDGMLQPQLGYDVGFLDLKVRVSVVRFRPCRVSCSFLVVSV